MVPWEPGPLPEETQGQEGARHGAGDLGRFSFLPSQPGLLVRFPAGSDELSHRPVWGAGPATPCPRGKQNDSETTRRARGFWCLSVDETWWLGLVFVRRSFQQKRSFPLLMCLFVSVLEKFHLFPSCPRRAAFGCAPLSLSHLCNSPLHPLSCSLPHVPVPQLGHRHNFILRLCLQPRACTEEKPSAFFCMASFFA